MNTNQIEDESAAILRARLADFRTENRLSNNQIGKLLGIDGTTVSRYVNGKYTGDNEKLSAAVADMLRAKSEEREIQSSIFRTSVTVDVFASVNLARRTGEVSLIYGDAGCGKTKALELYLRDHPVSVLATLNERRRDGQGVLAAIFEAVESRTWKGNTSRWKWLVQRLSASNRTLLIDNAQRLNLSGLAAIFDFHDQTNIPILLCGNPELLDTIRKSDQFFSRLGPEKKVGLDPAELAATSLQVARQFVPWADEIADLVAVVASHKGQLRAVKKQCLLALAMLEHGSKNPAQAFRDAHRHLVRDYQLPT
jgi:DNA transposition AAA+ family ATPase